MSEDSKVLELQQRKERIRFGGGTKAQVVAFQKAQGLVADGIVGVATWRALYQA